MSFNKTQTLYCFLWIILSFLIVFFFEVTISPRYNLFYGDSTVFQTIAYAWSDGNIPYRDFFDHKGPYLYLINLIGLAISDSWGLFLLSGTCLSITTIFLWLTSNLFIRKKQSLVCVLMFLGCYICLNSGGNMTESWCLPFNAIPLYLFCKSVIKGSYKWWYNIIYGFCFGIIALIRINNGIIPATILLALFIKSISNKNIGKGLAHIGIQLLGVILAIFPVLAYFIHEKAFEELIFANYTFNFEYILKWAKIAGDSQISSVPRIFTNLKWLLPLFILLAWSICDLLSKNGHRLISLMFSIACVVTIVSNMNGMDYLHYYIAFLPLIFMISVKVLKSLDKWTIKGHFFTKIMSGIFAIWALTIFIPSLFGSGLQIGKDVCKFGIIHSSVSNYEIDPIADMIEKNIPDHKGGAIYNVGTYEGAAAMLKTKTVPVGKYFFLQSKLCKVSDAVARELDTYHRYGKPDFIITNKENTNHGSRSFISMLERYQLVDSTANSIYLFKIKTSNHE